MLLTFICLTAAMVVFAIVMIGLPLLRKRTDDGEAMRREDNLRLLRQQFAELEDEFKAGRVTKEEYDETRAEIETRVLEETALGESDASAAKPSSRVGFITACALTVIVPVTAYLVYMQIGTPIALDPDFTRAQAQQQAVSGRASDAEVLEQIKLIEDRLKEQPDNLDGWMMLAKAQASFKNWQKSSEAFEQVARLLPGNPDVLADWADIMAAAQGGNLEGRPKELIEQALKIDPKHWKGLALMGTLCFDKGDYAGAVRYWSGMLADVEQGSEEWRQITENIEQARRMGGLPPDPNANLQAIDSKSGKKAAAPEQRFVAGHVSLAPEMAAKARPDDTVFVFARPTAGSKMPVAFMSFKVKELPRDFYLDSSSVMGMGMKTLNDVQEVIVEARVSRSGNFMAGSGDLEGAVEGLVPVGTKDLKIVINKVRP